MSTTQCLLISKFFLTYKKIIPSKQETQYLLFFFIVTHLTNKTSVLKTSPTTDILSFPPHLSMYYFTIVIPIPFPSLFLDRSSHTDSSVIYCGLKFIGYADVFKFCNYSIFGFVYRNICFVFLPCKF